MPNPLMLPFALALTPLPAGPPASPILTFSPTSRTVIKKTTVQNINGNIVQMKAVVGGLLSSRARQLEKELKAGNPNHLPFKDIIFCDMGNPHGVGQTPLTFVRQTLALCTAPFLLQHPLVGELFPEDVIARAQRILGSSHGVGAYSEPKGLAVVRASVADFIARRDGHPADPEAIFLTSGASGGVKMMLNLLIRGAQDGVLVPIPQFPLYSASVTNFGGTMVGYYLAEGAGWGLDLARIRRDIADAQAKGITVRCIAVINPGNPTGQVLSKAEMMRVVELCEEQGLVLLADEVYQANVYDPTERPFVSFKSVVREMGSTVELASFHSISKGVMGECGLRGGYMELVNFLPDVMAQVFKAVAMECCASIPGQIALEMMVNPPMPGEPSHELWQSEYERIFGGLRHKAQRLAQALSELPGVRCTLSAGAMYAFPQITLGPRVLEEAAVAGLPADTFYCLRLLESTGVCVLPGSDYGQLPGTLHFRTTFLPSDEKLEEMVARIRSFHLAFTAAPAAEAEDFMEEA